MIYPYRLSDFLKQNRLAHTRRRHNQSPLPVAQRGDQIDCAGADRICLRILQHDSTLWKLRRKFFEIGRWIPFFNRLAFDCPDLVEREKLFALARKAQSSGQLLARTELMPLHES